MTLWDKVRSWLTLRDSQAGYTYCHSRIPNVLEKRIQLQYQGHTTKELSQAMQVLAYSPMMDYTLVTQGERLLIIDRNFHMYTIEYC